MTSLPRARRSNNNKWAEKKWTFSPTPQSSLPHTFPSVLFSGKILFYLKTSYFIIFSVDKTFKHYEKYLRPLGHCLVYTKGSIRVRWRNAWMTESASKNIGENRFFFTNGWVNSLEVTTWILLLRDPKYELLWWIKYRNISASVSFIF